MSFKTLTVAEQAHMACGPSRLELFEKIERLTARNKALEAVAKAAADVQLNYHYPQNSILNRLRRELAALKETE